ncbi:unnamed protein product [Acanthoscelides obtectus]|uniref:MADF domain-containing protein n=1 Tax=Acanthoscelides obtectus TaxID=200917 RepID=A0A9P0Q9B4_ACAOB|nr:unnamed protein product [Acanthoscelides obtectus]CAK1627236.1 hypothetical protein AOBTE_LOCUS4420 [Acanthoscelides obtectus]
MNDPTLTVKIIKTKIKNLRSVYHSKVKKINSSKRSGSGAATVYSPSLTWFKEMHSFLGDTGDYRETIETAVDTDESSQDSRPTSANSNSNPLSPPSVITVMSPPSTTDIALNRLENITSSINRQAEYDEFHFFGLNIAAQLRALPLDDALNVQTEIQTIITAARRRHLYPNLSTYSTSPIQIIIPTPIFTNIQTNNSQTEAEDALSRAWRFS